MNLLSPGTEHADIVKVSLVTFLNALTMSCPHVKIDWEISRQWYNVKLGSAEFTVKIDGLTHQRRSADVFYIIETKPYFLAHNADETLMQMGMESLGMITHLIVTCYFRRQNKEEKLCSGKYSHENNP